MDLPRFYVIEDGVPAIVRGEEDETRELIELPDNFFAPGSARHCYLWIDGAWTPDVEGERALLWSAVKRARDAAIDGGCDTPLGRVQTDAVSRAAINQAWGEALADPDGFSRVWTMEDNSDEAVDHDAMRQIKLAVDAHVEAQRTRARMLRDMLNDEENATLAGLRAIEAF